MPKFDVQIMITETALSYVEITVEADSEEAALAIANTTPIPESIWLSRDHAFDNGNLTVDHVTHGPYEGDANHPGEGE